MKVRLHAILFDSHREECAYSLNELLTEIKRVLQQDLLLEVQELKLEEIYD